MGVRAKKRNLITYSGEERIFLGKEFATYLEQPF